MEIDAFHLFIWEPIWFEGTPFEINRVVLLMYVMALFLVGLFFWISRRKKLEPVPKGIGGNLAETTYLFVKNSIAIDTIGPEGAKYANYLTSLFVFIFGMSILEIVPGVNFPVTSRMAIPALLALLTWIIFNFVGFKHHGLRYLKDTLFPPGVPWPIYIILAPIELVSVFVIRPLTLAIRLFANLMAGHVLLTVFFLFTEELLLHGGGPFQWGLSVVTFLVACGLIVFELMVITIQSYIFTMLSAFYIAESLHGHGDHDEHEAAHSEHSDATPLRETELQPA
jgi:F-type H+-transporting ATPase subunit a